MEALTYLCLRYLEEDDKLAQNAEEETAYVDGMGTGMSIAQSRVLL